MQAWLYAHRRRLALVTGCVALAGLASLWLTPLASDLAVKHPLPADAPVRVPAPGQAPANPVATSALPRNDAQAPPGVTNEQWLELRAQLEPKPGGAAELLRIADYLHWSDLLRRFRDAQGDALERQRLALALDAGLPTRLREREVSAAEARQIKSAILDATLADPAERAVALRGWVVAEAVVVQPDPRQAEFERRQAVIVAAWTAQPARDRAALEGELEALRGQLFGARPPPATR